MTTSSPPQPDTVGYLYSVVDGAPGAKAAAVRALLTLLSGLHWIVLNIWRATYTLGLARVTRLPVQVISVGNLSLGGTGKTLAVQRLVRELTAAGKRVAILSRGYGRRSREEQVALCGEQAVASEAGRTGDEPWLLATSLPGTPVIVGKDRRRTGRRAIEEFGAEVLVLDDGFQYWRLHKDREIVLLDALQPATRDHLLPRGIFREPWSHLRRAHEVWITHAQLADSLRVVQLTAQVIRHAPHAIIRYTEHQPTHLRSLQGETASLDLLHGHRILALSGLGNPRQFELMLEKLGLSVTPCRFPDHHRYTEADIQTIAAQLAPDMLIVTTAKDAVRLPKDLPFAVWVIEVEMGMVSK